MILPCVGKLVMKFTAHRTAGIIWGQTHLQNSMTVCPDNYKDVLIPFPPHTVIPCLEIYPMELIQTQKG